MCKRTTLYFGAATLIMLTASIHAQPLSPITMSSAGFNCTTPAGGQAFAVSSYTLKANNSTADAFDPSPPDAIRTSLHVSKAADACSPVLLSLVAGGTILKAVTLVDNLTGKIVALSDVIISAALLNAGDNGLPTESIGLNFQRIEFKYTAQNQSVGWGNEKPHKKR